MEVFRRTVDEPDAVRVLPGGERQSFKDFGDAISPTGETAFKAVTQTDETGAIKAKSGYPVHTTTFKEFVKSVLLGLLPGSGVQDAMDAGEVVAKAAAGAVETAANEGPVGAHRRALKRAEEEMLK